MRSSKDFSQTTKTGYRVTNSSLVLYFLTDPSFDAQTQVGLIINKSIGGSVLRHRIARQLRHAIRQHLLTFPQHTQVVIRVLKPNPKFNAELAEVISKAITKLTKVEK